MKCFLIENRTVIALALFISLMLNSYSANAENFKIITMNVAPWAYIDKETNKFLGIFPEIVDAIEKRTNHTIKITLTPYARINRELEAGRQDCTMLIREKSRDEITTLGELIFYHPMGIIPKNDIVLNDYDDMYGITISVLRNLVVTQKFENDKKLKKEVDTSYEMGLRKIKHGRLDAIAGAIPTIQFLAKREGVEDLLGKPLELNSDPVFLQCSTKSLKTKYIQDINKAIKDIRSSGELDSILKKY